MHAPHDGGLRDRPAAQDPEAQGPSVAGKPIGRDTELREVEGLLSRATGSGEVLLVTGPIGIGKTSVLRAAATHARRAGFTVVEISGHRAEADVTGAGLTQLLLRLPAFEREPAAPGAGELFATQLVATVEDPFSVGAALVRALVRRTGAGVPVPLLITVDDAQWFDAPSLDALARAVQGMRRGPVALVAATRSGDRRAVIRRFRRLGLRPLDPADGKRLLDTHTRFLPPPLVSRVLAEARGNPAGIIGIARALRYPSVPVASLMAPWLPLGDPLQHTVGSLLDGLPSAAREFLLLAAVAHTDRVDILLEASRASGIDHGPVLSTAEQAGLVSVTEGRLRFVHPLLPSALHWGSSHGRRRPAHLALAEALADTPYLRALHAAAVSTDPDEATAAALEEGTPADLPQAAAVLERAADLSPRGEERIARLVRAAHAADLRGQVRTLRRLVGRIVADPMAPSMTAQACALEARAAYSTDATSEHAIPLLVRSAAAPSTQWPPPFASVACSLAPALYQPAWGRALRPALEAGLGEPGRENDPHLLSALCWMDRSAYGAPARALLDDAVAEHGAGAPARARTHGVAHVVTATALDDPVTVDLLGNDILRSLTDLGHFGDAVIVLTHLQMAHVLLGRRAAVEEDADLGCSWAQAAEDTCARLSFRTGVAQAQAWTGEEDGHRGLMDEVLSFALPRRLQMLAARARWAHGLMSLTCGRPEEAFEELRMMSTDCGDAWHPVVAGWALGDYVAAAVAVGRADEVRDRVRAVTEADRGVRSPLVGHLVARSRALLSDGDEAEGHFMEALTPRSAPLRYELARTELAFGQWLRRRRRVREARPHLQRAYDTFTDLGADAWARGATSELIATGEASASARPDWAARLSLTPREAEVARLAAAGLTNQMIGWRLGLTHRTVASHLSRVFVKAGVASRGRLSSLLEPE
ncbi:AAA family ATPase [Streptomyces sp. NPDC059651]|uniref:AAA family ATPase n=1 Tax=Streptomyces sp. NPDC059651 TaxID=3346897 RepID=UPI0036B032B2